MGLLRQRPGWVLNEAVVPTPPFESGLPHTGREGAPRRSPPITYSAGFARGSLPNFYTFVGAKKNRRGEPRRPRFYRIAGICRLTEAEAGADPEDPGADDLLDEVGVG